ncbi:SDR family oxidoreductase [Streptacidiphilus sp. ASG 303]|uniref:oxidoreductase n=1 Tax=Streptacidiphilus sp. ASG 303 TaxID=2896847 RepID=UPI001E5601C9|nr:oxidoreductase [Streptacidiphilus sp. ASG 303]MCD0486359.1 SDR family oxidoreductase [Streptacidiphilus sp. ASG 303]
MDLHLKGKTVVVTGASRGIGLATAVAFAAEGAHVVAGARNPGPVLEELALTHGLVPVAGDLATAEGVERLVATAVERFGGVDVLVNNVGAVQPRLGGFLSVTDEDWLATLNLNLMSAVRACRAALPSLLASRDAIVNVSSVNAFLPDPGVIDYTASKAAMTNFSKALSKEVGPQGVRVNSVAPGPVSTDIWKGAGGMADQIAGAMGVDLDTAVEQAVAGLGGFATGRFTRPDEVADLVLMLAGDRTANITGTDVTIDGGLVKTL